MNHQTSQTTLPWISPVHALCNGSKVPHSYSWQLVRPSQVVSCPIELTSVNLYRARPQTIRITPSAPTGPGRQGADGDKGVARIGWARMSGLNGTEVDTGFSIPHRTIKGVDPRDKCSLSCSSWYASGEQHDESWQRHFRGYLLRKWVSALANWWPTCCSSVCAGRAQQMVCGLLCARECDQVAQGSDANARKQGRLRDWVGENVTVRKFSTPILGSWQGRYKLSLALWS
ncbi:hypothetical protein GH714_018479 [Hevea brasiliensis]|uniref:Uncharacterized protein n=1 Tax=Hevea brasiliensis TaxID=3981 RepID=A0A6A6N374_HEVBR|nr:hypothetical protein GH714_018479 [Hevea brasiliensis]